MERASQVIRQRLWAEPVRPGCECEDAESGSEVRFHFGRVWSRRLVICRSGGTGWRFSDSLHVIVRDHCDDKQYRMCGLWMSEA